MTMSNPMTWCVTLLQLLVSLSLIYSCSAFTIDQMINEAYEKSENETRNSKMGRSSDSGVVRIEYDMRFDFERLSEMRRLSQEPVPKRRKRKAASDIKYRWPKNVIPFRIIELSSRDATLIVESMLGWSQYTCLQFRPRVRSDRAWLSFVDGEGCSSEVGYLGPQEHLIFLHRDCRYKPLIMHEVGHTIGLYHEQSRPDRDKYIKIQWDNIQFHQKQNFNKWKNVINTYGVPYDYKSLMHYGKKAFSFNGQTTIETVDKSMQDVIGTATGPSFADIKTVNLFYNCAGHCRNPPTCGHNEFLGRDCKCWCPGNPAKLCKRSVWSPWGAWGACSHTCNHGTQRRFRQCPSSSGCLGHKEQTQPCLVEICKCVHTLTQSKGIITSPNYPENYRNHEVCSWIIKVPSGPIKLSFNVLQLENCLDCSCDYVKVFEGSTEVSPLVTACLPAHASTVVQSKGNTMLVKFVSDYNEVRKGFHATYTEISGWSGWTLWTKCSVTCGDGIQLRKRQCRLPNASACPGPSSGRRHCNDSPCNGELLSCDFESPCDLEIKTNFDSFEWGKINCCTRSGGTGPDKDHTFDNNTGHFIYTEASQKPVGGIALMQTPELRSDSGQICLSFWYHMKGEHMGSLSILLTQAGASDLRLFTKKGDQGKNWIGQKVSVGTLPSPRFQIQFEAIRGSYYKSDIALDDINIRSGSCQGLGRCGLWTSWSTCSVTCGTAYRRRRRWCNNGQTTHSDFERCRLPPCPRYLLNCDFEKIDNCLVNVKGSDDFDWWRIRGSTPSVNTGPSGDHTLQSGYYIYAEATSKREGARAILQREITAHSGSVCLHFWYHMWGGHMGSLNVNYQQAGQSLQTLWARSGDQGKLWKEQRLTINTSTGIRFTLQFVATIGHHYMSDVALDDVTLIPGTCGT